MIVAWIRMDTKEMEGSGPLWRYGNTELAGFPEGAGAVCERKRSHPG